MHFLCHLIFACLLGAIFVSSSTVYVENKCGDGHPVVLRGAWGVVLAQGYVNPGQTWSYPIDANNCHSCNVATNTGGTLLAECK